MKFYSLGNLFDNDKSQFKYAKFSSGSNPNAFMVGAFE